MRKIRIVIVAVVVLVIILNLAQAQAFSPIARQLIGSWRYEVPQEDVSLTYEFKEDNEGILMALQKNTGIEMKIPFHYWIEEDYKSEGTKLIVVPLNGFGDILRITFRDNNILVTQDASEKIEVKSPAWASMDEITGESIGFSPVTLTKERLGEKFFLEKVNN